jgi:hypothetical protein
LLTDTGKFLEMDARQQIAIPDNNQQILKGRGTSIKPEESHEGIQGYHAAMEVNGRLESTTRVPVLDWLHHSYDTDSILKGDSATDICR